MSLTQDDLLALLRDLAQADATELHLKVPARPLLRRDGALLPTDRPALTPEATQRLATLLLGLARVEMPLATVTHREFSFGVPKLGRFHATVYRQRGSLAMQITRIAFSPPSLAELGLDSTIEDVLDRPGLVLLCGGRRRTALMAALVDRYNATRRGLVVTVEDPLTCLHRDGTATIAQRGVGTDIPDLATGVCSARRQGADLIAVGDVPDRTTAEKVLDASEQGAVVLACVAAPDVNLAASWILRFFRDDRDLDVKARVKRQLRAVVCVPEAGASRMVQRKSVLRAAS